MEVLPFSKAPPRVEKQTKGRQRGRCRVLTDTPEKVELEAEQAERDKKASNVKKNFTHKNKTKNKSRQNENKKLKQLKGDSSEDEQVWEASDNSLDDYDPFSISSDDSEVEVNDFFEVCTPKIMDFVLVEFIKKKGTTYFVGQVTEVGQTPSEILVNFLRKKEAHFHFPATKDEGLVLKKNVKKVLPIPDVRRGHYNFKIKFPNVCIG